MAATRNPEFLLFADQVPPVSKELYDVLKLVVTEWESDPASVQCFDLRVVDRAKKAVAEFDRCHPPRRDPFNAAMRARQRSGYTPARS